MLSISLEEALQKSGFTQVSNTWIAKGKSNVQVRCFCGTVFSVLVGSIKSSNTTSCGCKRHRSLVSRNTTHGNASRSGRHPIYQVWANIIQRCTNPKNPKFPDYGGRGITVCQRWAESFEAFLADVGERPFAKAEIDRIKNDRGYEPGNVQWSTRTQQNRNRRNNRIIKFNGRSMCIADWATELGWSYMGIFDRIKRLPLDQAMIQKPNSGKG